MRSLRVINPGMLTTVQDLGRPGFASMGVPTGGAADTLSLRIGNRLVGNPDNAAALEMTMTGGTFEFLDDALVTLTGGEAKIEIETTTGTKHTPQICSHIHLSRGDKLQITPITRGVRSYLCIAGGIEVNHVLGSASTLLSAQFGGFQGRSLKAGDVLTWSNINSRAKSKIPSHITQIARSLNELLFNRTTLRTINGPHINEFTPATYDTFFNTTFRISSRSNRVGVRLEGAITTTKSTGRMPSMGMMHGAIQVPPGGEPIILMADHPTTGGYPVIACVATVDLPKLGQLRPGEIIRFARITRDEALLAFHEQETQLNSMEQFL